MTNSQLDPATGEERGRFSNSVFRPGRFFTVTAVLLLALLAVGCYWVMIRQRPVAIEQAPANREAIPAIAVPIPIKEIIGSFHPNQTITQALSQHGLSLTLIHQIVESARPLYNLAKVKARQFYSLCVTPEGQFRNFRYPLDDKQYLTVYHDEAQDRLVSVVKDFQYETRVESVSAGIESSLFASIEGIGEKDQLALDMADVFSFEIDFNTDIQKGDSFRALVEKKYLDNQFRGYGAILAASFSNGQKTITGFRFTDENGKPAYYGSDGKALKKSFLKSPLKFTRISSRFSLSRMHPILKVLRPHLGVDYAAPVGTPVHAVGSGIVTSAGTSGASGLMVKLRHTSGYETMYLHLSRIAVKHGARVSQGEVIGYVGSSGLSTGPHLDFRVYRHGKAINPLKVVSPPAAPVSPARFDEFAALRDKLKTELRMTN